MPKSISLTARLRRVKLFLTDVDGVMTDGTVIMGPGIELKQYDIQDGLGIIMLRHNGIKTGWVSARKSAATEVRAKDLKVIQTVKTAMHPIGITYDTTTDSVWVSCYRGVVYVMADRA